jgi:L-histidine N-alpha-methyltransferase
MDILLKEKETEVGQFAKDVLKGLSSSPKKLLSKYLYDNKGSKLFEEIMHLPEYYPTKCEFEILENYKKQILEFFSPGEELEMVDLGAGNGLKTMILVKLFLRKIKFRYASIDISEIALVELENSLKNKFPSLSMESLHTEYIDGLKKLKKNNDTKKLVLFLGSNIGNFTIRESLQFLKEVKDSLNKDDLFLIGFDLKKDPEVVRKAYNDSKGVTSEFNLNILKRINTELGARFDLQKFLFYPTYDPITGETKSYVISKERQEVYIERLDKSFVFEKWEAVHTECSNKFDAEIIKELAEKSGFAVEANFHDSKEYFVDSLWRAI